MSNDKSNLRDEIGLSVIGRDWSREIELTPTPERIRELLGAAIRRAYDLGRDSARQEYNNRIRERKPALTWRGRR